MRQHSFKINASLANGLPRDARIDAGAPWMATMENMKPLAIGAVTPDPVVRPPGIGYDVAVTWPNPVLIRQDDVTLLLDADGVATVQVDGSSWTTEAHTVYRADDPEETQSIAATSPWQVAARHGTWVATCGSHTVFQLPSNPDGKVLGTDAVRIEAVCRHRNRLLLGGFSGDWFVQDRFLTVFDLWRSSQTAQTHVHMHMALGANWIAWGDPGGGDNDIPDMVMLSLMGLYGDAGFDQWETEILTRIERQEIGFAPVSTPGTVLGIHSHGERAVALSTHGLSVLLQVPDGSGYREEEAYRVGVVGRGAFAGTDRELVWVGPDGLHRWMLGDGIVHWDWGWLLDEMAEPVVSYDPLHGDYWVVDADRAYIVTQRESQLFLGGPMDIRPTGLFRDPVYGLVGMAGDGAETDPEGPLVLAVSDVAIRTNRFNMGDRDWKFCGQVQVRHEGLVEPKVRLVTREGAEDDDIARDWSQVNELDTTYHEASFTDAAVELESEVAGPARLHGLKIEYGAEGRQHRRGTDSMEEMA